MQHETNGIAQAKIELIKKIVNAKLTKKELQAITTKTKEILSRRPCSQSLQGNGEKVLHDIPIYNQTDTEGILKEALSNQ